MLLERFCESHSGLESHTLADGINCQISIMLFILHATACLLHPVLVEQVGKSHPEVLVDGARQITRVGIQQLGDSETFTVKIVCGADQDASDDESEPFTIVIIHPDVPAPTDLDYTTDGDVTTFTWVAPEGLDGGNEIVTDDFESYKNGDRTFGDWICQDKAWFGDYGVIDIELDGYEIYIPHNTETQAFMVYNPASCFIDLDEHPEWQPHSGNKMIVSFADYANDFGYENDDWLISPELSGEEQTISFYARTASTSKRNDYIQVRYSTTGTATSDFTLLPDGEIRLENGWTRYEYTLPAGTRYFAIRNNSEEGLLYLSTTSPTPLQAMRPR